MPSPKIMSDAHYRPEPDDLMQEVLLELREMREDITEVKIAQAQMRVVQDGHTTLLVDARESLSKRKRFEDRWMGAWTLIGVLGVMASIAVAVSRFYGG
jgi:hypothetical protein